VDAPWRHQLKDTPAAPSAAKLAADALEAEHRRRAEHRKHQGEETAERQAKARFAAKLKRDKEAKEREAARQKASAAAAAKARKKAELAQEAERQRRAADDADSRARMQKSLAAEEAERNFDPKVPMEAYFKDAEEAARRMRDRWRRAKAAATPSDPFAEWRGTTEEEGEDEGEEREGEEDEDEDEAMVAGMSDEELAQVEARRVKMRERDAAARRILAHSSKTLMDALGLPESATDAEVDSTARKLLRLLHPDYAINLAGKGSRQQRRIEAAFKRLNGLRAEADT